MCHEGRVQGDPQRGVVAVVNDADPHTYPFSAVGTVFATFAVPASALVPGSLPGWSRILGRARRWR
jgi:hypothetical protein